MYLFEPILCHLYLSTPPENIKKTGISCYLLGVQKETNGMKRVKTGSGRNRCSQVFAIKNFTKFPENTKDVALFQKMNVSVKFHDSKYPQLQVFSWKISDIFLKHFFKQLPLNLLLHYLFHGGLNFCWGDNKCIIRTTFFC